MYNSNDIEVKFDAKYLPIEYKLLEWRLIINRELYEESVINLKIYSIVEKSILRRMGKIRNEVQENINNDLINGRILS